MVVRNPREQSLSPPPPPCMAGAPPGHGQPRGTQCGESREQWLARACAQGYMRTHGSIKASSSSERSRKQGGQPRLLHHSSGFPMPGEERKAPKAGPWAKPNTDASSAGQGLRGFGSAEADHSEGSLRWPTEPGMPLSHSPCEAAAQGPRTWPPAAQQATTRLLPGHLQPISPETARTENQQQSSRRPGQQAS